MSNFIEVLTLVSGLLIVYHHIGYPLFLKYLSTQSVGRSVYKRGYKTSSIDSTLPTITLIMPAYNEADVIRDKILNLACLDYLSHKLTLIIGCDGCTDDTVNIAQRACREAIAQHLNIQVIDFKTNRGKVAVLNELIPNVDTELVALSDVSALLSVDALIESAHQFKDPKIGVLTGIYKMLNPGSEGEKSYWEYQANVKQKEANLGSTIGVHGAFYVFRTHLFQTLKSDTINDDFILPMSIVSRGYKASMSTHINALELESVGMETDHKRRQRIAAGNMQQLWRLKALLKPKHRGVAFNFASGKALRTLMPFLLITAFLGAGYLALNSTMYQIAFITQAIVYVIGLYTLWFKPTSCPKVCLVISYILSGYTAGFIGAMRYLLGLERGRWFRV